MSEKSTAYYVVKTLAGAASVIISAVADQKGYVRNRKAYKECITQGSKSAVDGAKGLYDNYKKNH